MTTHIVPFHKLSVLTDRVNDLNKRGAKLGLEPLTFEAREFWARQRAVYDDGMPDGDRYVIKRYYSVQFTSEVPRYHGHRFVAVLEHHEAGNIVAKAPWAQEMDLSAWLMASSRCQHCGVYRRRIKTVLVQTPDNGLIQVGTDCLVDYIGSADAEMALRLWSLWAELGRSLGEDTDGEFGWGGARGEVATVDYVAAAVSSVRRRGYHKAMSEGQSTRSDVAFACGNKPQDRGNRGERELVEYWKEAQPTEADRARAAAAMAWVAANGDRSEYMHNLRVACSEPIVGDRAGGLLASLPAAFDKHEGVERERQQAPKPAGFFGKVGERVERFVELDARIGYESLYGAGAMLIVRDQQNYYFQTFTSGEARRIEDWSGLWAIRGTVKKHDTDRKGRPVTVLARCTVERVLTKAEAHEAA